MKKKKNSRKKTNPVIVPIKKGFYTACLLVVIVVVSLFLYEEMSDFLNTRKSWIDDAKDVVASDIDKHKSKYLEIKKSKEQESHKKQKEEPIQKQSLLKRKSEKENTTKDNVFTSGAELPHCKKASSEQIIEHKGYTVSYNSDYCLANWVAYELTLKEVKSNIADRSNKFVRDPKVKGASAENGDYTRTGYDRGHLAPAGDMKWSEQAMRESFYLSNITPQKPGLNRGVWKDLEEQCRMWAADNGKLLIATGPVLSPDLKRLGKNRVAIPKKFYKVICMIENNHYESVGFIFDNKDYDRVSLRSMMCPVDLVEDLVDIDFFYNLPDSIEEEMESHVNTNAWSF